jgi:hypothetical protein
MSTPATNDPVASVHAASKALHKMTPAALSPAPMMRAQKLHLMLAQFAARGMGQGAATAAVLPLQLDAGGWQELLAMQQSVLQRFQQQQQDWLDGFAALAQEYGQSRQANTLSKYVEQEYNLVAQFGALVSNQAASMAGLLENIQVDYGYWMAQRQEQKTLALTP